MHKLTSVGAAHTGRPAAEKNKHRKKAMGSERGWLQSRTRGELRRALGMLDPPVPNTREAFSAYNPMAPLRYVPEWQTDMQNRDNIIQVTHDAVAVQVLQHSRADHMCSSLNNS